MAKFLESPGVAVLRQRVPARGTLPAGTTLARVYFAGGTRRLTWNAWRFFGPLDARWDHHRPDASGAPCLQARGVFYAALDAKTCFAEVFQHTRRLDRTRRAPRLVVPQRPRFHRALGDDFLLDPLKRATAALGYALV